MSHENFQGSLPIAAIMTYSLSALRTFVQQRGFVRIVLHSCVSATVRQSPKRTDVWTTSLRIRLNVPPLQATKALRVGRGIVLPFLRPRH